MLQGLQNYGVKDPQLADTLAALNKTLNPGKTGIFPSTATDADKVTQLMQNTTDLFEKTFLTAYGKFKQG